MGKIVVSENVTLDGVVQDPAGAEGFGRGGWVGRVGERGREEADARRGWRIARQLQGAAGTIRLNGEAL
jgi:hypothetical protein